MFGLKLLAVFIVAAAISFCCVPWSICLAHKVGAVDKPNARKVHTKLMPRIGGVAIFSGVIIPGIYTAYIVVHHGEYLPFAGIIAGGIIVFTVGLLDDLYQLNAWTKLGGQCLAAAVAMMFGLRVHFITGFSDGMVWLGILSIPFTFVWLVGVTNAVNLIDGLDGLAAGVTAISTLSLGIVAHMQGQPALLILSVLIAGAVMGFLPYNFHPARTFMGDCGSNFLGFMLGSMAILGMAKTTAVISFAVPILILGVPILDTFFAIIRRLHNGVGIFQPDKNHLHHRLMVMGLSHRATVLVIYGISAFFGMGAVLLKMVSTPKAMLILVLILLAIAYGVGKTGICTARMPETDETIINDDSTGKNTEDV